MAARVNPADVFGQLHSPEQTIMIAAAVSLALDKEKSTEKVDGAVALVMALDRALKNENAAGSIYDVRDMLTLDW